jgi:hypothetical protein
MAIDDESDPFLRAQTILVRAREAGYFDDCRARTWDEVEDCRKRAYEKVRLLLDTRGTGCDFAGVRWVVNHPNKGAAPEVSVETTYMLNPEALTLWDWNYYSVDKRRIEEVRTRALHWREDLLSDPRGSRR